MSWPKLHVTHKLACAFQQTLRIGNCGTSKEPDIHMVFEGVDVSECRVSYTRRRMAIMQQFSHIVSTLTHNLEPMLRDYTQFPCVRLHPSVDLWITLNRIGETQELSHALGLTRTSSATAPAGASGSEWVHAS